MIIDTEQERLIVVSDLHIGNPFSTASHHLDHFFEYASRHRFNVCINGDGFEILQASFASLAFDSVGVLQQIRRLLDAGLEVFYVVGNHDIVLEHFLSAWSGIHITPFLNVVSGDQRIRVEHGHLYDPSFVKSPRAYEWLTRAAGPLLHVYPDVYRVWSAYESLKRRLQVWRGGALVEQNVYYEAAAMLLRRGFDAVIFGHTHAPEDVELEPGQRYVNSGTWVRGGTFVEVEHGALTLRAWDPVRLEPV
jgi:UDP-2,3-diacylglucosamine pyrophosphatase LpxH